MADTTHGVSPRYGSVGTDAPVEDWRQVLRGGVPKGDVPPRPTSDARTRGVERPRG